MLPMAGAGRSNLGCAGGAMSRAAGNRSGFVTAMAANEHRHPGSVSAPLTCPRAELPAAVKGCGGCRVTL